HGSQREGIHHRDLQGNPHTTADILQLGANAPDHSSRQISTFRVLHGRRKHPYDLFPGTRIAPKW
ncbi:MAG: hypothetical protein ACT4N2_14220, partial [Hyphomicrobium sp.]